MYPLIVATGPLTSESLSADIARIVGGDHLYFYDAISPIVLAETIDMDEGVPRVAVGKIVPGFGIGDSGFGRFKARPGSRIPDRGSATKGTI